MREPGELRNLSGAYDRAMRGPYRLVFGPIAALTLRALPGVKLKRLLGQAGSVLEVGCGQGYLLEKACCEVASHLTVGMDLSGVMLQIASKRLARSAHKRHIQLLQGEATRIPFSDNTFDAVLSMGMMEHLDDNLLSQFMVEAARVLVPRGRLLASTFSPKSTFVALGRGRRWTRRFVPAYGRNMVGRTSEELCVRALEAGFASATNWRPGMSYTGVFARRA